MALMTLWFIYVIRLWLLAATPKSRVFDPAVVSKDIQDRLISSKVPLLRAAASATPRTSTTPAAIAKPWYPTTRKPPCRWLADVELGILKCTRFMGKTIGFTYLRGMGVHLRTPGGPWWATAAPREHTLCARVDVWIIHAAVLTSPQLPTAIASLSNAPSTVVIDDSGELGQMEYANCFFNQMRVEHSIHGSENITFILVSQAASIRRLGQRLFNQHWAVPRRLALLESLQATGAASEINGDSLDRSALNGGSSLKRANSNHLTHSRVLCLGGFPRPHKVQFMGELDARGLLERMLWSAGSPEPWLTQNLNMSLVEYGYTAQEADEGRQFMRDKLPRVLDLDRGKKKASDMTFDSSLYALAPVHLVIESNDRAPSIDRHACARTNRYTEKTLKAMYARARFVVFGDPGSLELLRNHGFRTFHPHINETYDAIPTYREKSDALHAEIARILLLSEADFGKLLLDTAPIVEHNRQWLLSEEFAAKVHKQSLYAFGVSGDEPAFQSLGHERLLDAMYASLGVEGCTADK